MLHDLAESFSAPPAIEGLIVTLNRHGLIQMPAVYGCSRRQHDSVRPAVRPAITAGLSPGPSRSTDVQFILKVKYNSIKVVCSQRESIKEIITAPQ
jgi:hypothetical protein